MAISNKVENLIEGFIDAETVKSVKAFTSTDENNDSDVEKILKNKKLSLYSLIDESLDLKLNGLSKNTIFYLINSFKTLRYEKEIKNNLLVLDQTFFQNQAIDYELEVEGQSSSAAKKYFKSILEKYSIPNRGKMPKIARAEKNKADRAL